MTANEFDNACCERTIAPSVALENESVRDALSRGDDDDVLTALDSEF
ncbi:MAG: hypothetical protein R8K20_03515 [Gallionellaceae bacterium]